MVNISASLARNNMSIAQKVSEEESAQVEESQEQVLNVSQQVKAAVNEAFRGTDASPLLYQEVTDTVVNIAKQKSFSLSQMSIDALIAAVMLDRYNAMQDLVQRQAEKVQQMNDQLRALGMLKSDLAVYGTDVSKPDDTVNLDKDGSKFAQMQKIAADNNLAIDWASFGIKDAKITQGNLAKLNQTIDTMTTSSTNIQSTEYNKLQDYAQKLTQALDLASNISKKLFDAVSNIVANLR